jgi:hypothetical protein
MPHATCGPYELQIKSSQAIGKAGATTLAAVLRWHTTHARLALLVHVEDDITLHVALSHKFGTPTRSQREAHRGENIVARNVSFQTKRFVSKRV